MTTCTLENIELEESTIAFQLTVGENHKVTVSGGSFTSASESLTVGSKLFAITLSPLDPYTSPSDEPHNQLRKYL